MEDMEKDRLSMGQTDIFANCQMTQIRGLAKVVLSRVEELLTMLEIYQHQQMRDELMEYSNH